MNTNEIVTTGKTVEEAIESACVKLGCERDNCKWEIIDLPKKGFLGIKNIPAKVRVSIETPDETPPAKAVRQPDFAGGAKKNSPPAREQAQPKAQRPNEQAQPRAQRPNEQAQPKAQRANEQAQPKAQRANEQAQPKAQRPNEQAQPKTQRANEQARPPKAPQTKKNADSIKPVSAADEASAAKAALGEEYLTGILDAMKLSANISANWEESGVCLNINGDSLGSVIGRHGETLDALQYLCGLVANRAGGDYLRIMVDCGEYRVKRKATLETLAHKLSAQVLKTNVSKVLEPMNSFERRIIHATVSTISGVSSTSLGEEPNRRVVITSPTAKNNRRPYVQRSSDRTDNRPQRSEYKTRGGYDHSRGGGRAGRGDSAPGSSASFVAAPPANPPREADDAPLYGKIEL